MEDALLGRVVMQAGQERGVEMHGQKSRCGAGERVFINVRVDMTSVLACEAALASRPDA